LRLLPFFENANNWTQKILNDPSDKIVDTTSIPFTKKSLSKRHIVSNMYVSKPYLLLSMKMEIELDIVLGKDVH